MSVTVRPDGPTRDPEAGSAPAPSFAALALQLLLILLVIRVFRIEERRGLFALGCLAAVGYLIYRCLPAVRRPAFFLGVSLAAFPLAFAWPHLDGADPAGWLPAVMTGGTQAAWVFGLGGLLFGLCHLPLPFAARIGLVAAAAGGLVVWRADDLTPFWAVLGSIFMFRLWIYLREIRREMKPTPWSRRLAYFFLMPNAFFPFFPLVDYRKFRDGYRPDDESVAQRGVAWILRGLVHLLLYRAIKLYLLPTPFDLIDIEYVLLFLVTNYGLYLRISGYFHVISGMLHLFGHDLPRTHDRYFLASSFSDIWRRINIYWKDFLADHVFFPVFFSLRRLPRSSAVFAAVIVTFAATWVLHSWQVFWLAGDFPVAGRDAALWFSAGTLVALNSLWQYRRAATGPGDAAADLTPTAALQVSLQVVGTFLVVSYFWACWTMPHFSRLFAAVIGSGGVRPEGVAVIAGTLITVVAGGTAAQLLFDRLRRRGYEPALPLEHSPALCVCSLALLAAAGLPQVTHHLGYETARQIARLQQDAPTAAEAGSEMEGYYEGLADVNLQSDPFLRGLDQGRPRREVVWQRVTRERRDLVGREMIPGWTGELAGVPFRVNRWGMHDHDHSRRKPPGVYRVAVAGSSATMGLGVPEDANFPSLVERRVNARLSETPRVEFMNFASGGYTAFQWPAVLREKVYPFDPDVVCYVVHQGELRGSTRNLARCYVLGYPRPYPCLDGLLDEAGVREDMPWAAIEVGLEPYARQTLACIYRGIVADCRERGVRPVWVYVPLPGVEGVPGGMVEMLTAMAREAGFTVIDLSGWDEGHDPDGLVVDGHYHPSILGHRLIADSLFGALQTRPGVLPPGGRDEDQR